MLWHADVPHPEAIALGGRWMEDDFFEGYGEELKQLHADYAKALARQNWKAVDNETRALLRRSGIPIEPDSGDYREGGAGGPAAAGEGLPGEAGASPREGVPTGRRTPCASDSSSIPRLRILANGRQALALRRLHLDLAQLEHDLLRARLLPPLHIRLLRSRLILSISPVQSQPVRSQALSSFNNTCLAAWGYYGRREAPWDAHAPFSQGRLIAAPHRAPAEE